MHYFKNHTTFSQLFFPPKCCISAKKVIIKYQNMKIEYIFVCLFICLKAVFFIWMHAVICSCIHSRKYCECCQIIKNADWQLKKIIIILLIILKSFIIKDPQHTVCLANKNPVWLRVKTIKFFFDCAFTISVQGPILTVN